MTRDEAKQLLPIISAFADGARLQEEYEGRWFDIGGSVSFSLPPSKYRIAPSPKERSWTRDELEDRICRGAVVRHKASKAVDTIVRVDTEGIAQMYSGLASAPGLLEFYELIGIDGARLPNPEPCGVRE